MKKYKILGLFCTSLLLIACSDKATYNEAEMIRKLDSLQQTISHLTDRIEELELQVGELSSQQEVITPIVSVTTTTKIPVTTAKSTTKTTKPTKPSTTVTTSPSETIKEEVTSIFDLGDFDKTVISFKQNISDLSASIASSKPSEDENVKFDEFYAYQEQLRELEDEIKSYQTAMKIEYDNLKIEQAVFIEKERQLSKLNDALIALEDQLEVKYGMTD